MDKNKLKTFAIESRRQLIEDTTYQANLLGITKDGIQDPIEEAEGMQAFDIGGTKPYVIYDEDIEKRANLVKEVQDRGFENVIEEVAYTWFNRIIAIRYMEVNDYLPTRVRVLSSETLGRTEPEIINESCNIDLDLTNNDLDYILKLKNENKLDELFKFLFIKQCNKLNEVLPELFKRTEDFMELLLSLSFINENQIVRNLIDDIPEEYFKNQVEIIGWLYQFYNTELKDNTFEEIKKNKKVNKEKIPVITQLFTPDWIVKYMVENSLGRYWLKTHPNDQLKNKWKYYLEDVEQDISLKNKLNSSLNENINNPVDIKVIDPCMGSGHILLYVFDILISIYESTGYTKKDAAVKILENNLYGLDIDKRAYQLAYFSIMMKARFYNNQIFKENIQLNLSSFWETNSISNEFLDLISSNNRNMENDLKYLVKTFKDAQEYGSIINVKSIDFEAIIRILNQKNCNDLNYLTFQNELDLMKKVLLQYKILHLKYDVVITNPPYMGLKGMNSNLKDFLNKNYPDSKYDLYAVFIEKCIDLTKENRFYSMITQHSFMFISSYEKLREKILKNTLINMIHLGTRAFKEIGGEVVQVTSFVNQKINVPNHEGVYCRLVNFNADLKEKEFYNKKNYFSINQLNFNSIPGNPIVYWMSENAIKNFENGFCINDISEHTGSQNKTANNKKYLRNHWEVSNNDVGINKKWVRYAKGGYFRKYYGNLDLVVDWSKEARDFYKNNKTSNLLDQHYWFKEGITYTKVTSNPNFRYLPPKCIFDMGGPSICYLNKKLYYILGLLNSVVVKYYLNVLNPTINIQAKDIKALPILYNENFLSEINYLVSECIEISKEDWDSFETSFDFKMNPLIKNKFNSIKKSYLNYDKHSKKQFNLLKSNEEKLNKIFLKIYNLEHDLNFKVDDEEVNVFGLDLYNIIIQFISFAVGCILGRYSLDEEGLVFAGGDFDLGVYSCFVPDVDNVVPVLDSEYFDDDVVGRFVEFVKVAFGEESLEENLDFIAGALKNKGSTSREVIRSYFLNDFFKDHVKMYKKCPIYWQFDSGKENGFKCLVYMHRYSPDLVARVRTDYLHKTQKAIESQISYEQNIKENSGNSKDQARADKRIKKLTKQLDETRRYDEALAHVASQNIEIDLDDGVKVNYAKFQNVEVSKEGQKVKKINLLKKI